MQRRFSLVRPTIIPRGNHFILEVPKNQRFIRDLKNIVPSIDRRWDRSIGTQGAWVIDIMHQTQVEELVAEYYPEDQGRG